MVWLQFIALAGCVVFAGVKLVKFGDIIAEKTGAGGIVIGITFLATVSSFPEAIVVITSGYIGDADLAIGTILGSNIFNLLIFAVLSFAIGAPFFYRLHKEHILVALFGALLTLMILIGIAIAPGLGHFFQAWRIGPVSILILLTYLVGTHLIFKHEMKNKPQDEAALYESTSHLRVYSGAFITTVILIISGIYLTRTADLIAKIPIGEVEIGATFVGSILLAVTTSLPELVISLAAVKMYLYDMAAANIMGSITFNSAIVFLADIFYQRGGILQSAALIHTMSGVFVIWGIGMVILGIVYRPRKGILRLGLSEWGIVLFYIFWVFLLLSFS